MANDAKTIKSYYLAEAAADVQLAAVHQAVDDVHGGPARGLQGAVALGRRGEGRVALLLTHSMTS